MKEPVKTMKVDALFGVRDKVVLIAGAGGIGEYLAEGFSANGARVVVTNNTPGKAEKVAQRLADKGLACGALQLDASNKTAVERAVSETAERYGRLDALINTVGITIHASPEDFTEEQIRKVIDVDLLSATFLTQAAGRIMIKQNYGKITHITSVAGSYVKTLESMPYGMSKAGVRMLVKNCAVIWAKHNVNVNAIAPTWVYTPMIDKESTEYIQSIIDSCGVGRMSYPADLLGTAIFLSSAASDYISGQEITVDAGEHCGKTL